MPLGYSRPQRLLLPVFPCLGIGAALEGLRILRPSDPIVYYDSDFWFWFAAFSFSFFLFHFFSSRKLYLVISISRSMSRAARTVVVVGSIFIKPP